MQKTYEDAEILERIKHQKEMWEQNVSTMKLEIEADIALIRGKKKKGKENLIWDFSMSSKINNLIARSYFTKSPIYIRPTQVGSEQIAKAQNKLYQEDRNTPLMRAFRYYKDSDKYSTGIAILAKAWWNGKIKSPIWERINPLLAVPDPFGDYFTGDYRYIGFYSIKTKKEMDDLGWDTSWCQDAVWGVKDRKRTEQLDAGVIPQYDNTIFDIYYHFERVDEGKVKLYIVNGNCTHILEEKDLDEMPFAFFYWKPNGTFFGDRPANYIRDTQKWKAEMRNLQADKVRQEVYVQWLYNSDFVSGKDIGFWLNKKIAVKSGLDGANVPISNLVTPIQHNTRIDSTNGFIEELEQDVSLALGIGEIAEGSTPDRRETAKTNSLIMDSTDIILSLNEELDSIGEQQFAILWYSAYYKNFKEADKKIIYAGSTTGQSPMILKRSDFIIEGNLSLEIETSSEREKRIAKEVAWRTQTSPLILNDQTINEASKKIVLRKLLLAWWMSEETIDQEVPLPAQYLQQLEENKLLKQWLPMEISPDDDDDQHLLAMWDVDPEDTQMVLHQYAHIRQKIKKWQTPIVGDNQMLNGAMSQAMSQAGSQTQQLITNQ